MQVMGTAVLVARPMAAGVVRCLVALLGLAASRVSLEVLSADDFISLTMCMMAVAVGGTLLFPLNRRFWAEYSADTFNAVLASGAVLFALIVPPICTLLLLLTHGTAGWDLTTPVLAAVCAVAYHASRCSYGSLTMQMAMAKGLMFSAALAGLELLSVLWMQATHNDQLSFRLLLPSLGFLAVLPLLNRWVGQTHARVLPVWKIGEVTRNAVADIVTALGLITIVASIFLTLGATVDRVALPAVCRGSGFVECDHLAELVLISVYCTAFLSILTLLVDWARPRVLVGGLWQPLADRRVIGAVAMIAVLTVAAIVVGWTAGRWLHLIPEPIEWSFWALMVARFGMLACINVVQIDLWMSKRIVLVLPAWIIATAVVPIALFAGAGSWSLAALLVVSDGVILLLLAWETRAFLHRHRNGNAA